MCRLYVSFVLEPEVHPGAETLWGREKWNSLFCSVRMPPALPQQPPLVFGEDFPKIRVASQPVALKPPWTAWLRCSPAPQRQQEPCPPLPALRTGPWAAWGAGLLSPSPAELSPAGDGCKDLRLLRPQCCSSNAELIAGKVKLQHSSD